MNDMRGLFFIVKGNYKRGLEPSFFNEVTKGTNYLGGYDPEDENTEEWYMLLDNVTYMCNSASSDFDKVVRCAYTLIKRHKGNLDKYVREMNSIRKVSASMRCIYEEVYKHYGDYFEAEIEEMEDLAYSELREERPIHKSRKLVAKTKPNTSVVMEKTEKVIDTTPKGLVKPKVKIGVKKLQMK